MDVFALRDDLIGTYEKYATSFMHFRDRGVDDFVQEALGAGKLWPNPSVGLNPSFEPGGSVDDLADEGLLHPLARDIFRLRKSHANRRGKPLRLYKHQTKAIRTAAGGHNYVLTTGTGSGKSLAYIVPIVDHVLRVGSGGSVKALVVYPMNALANSQREELGKFLNHGPWGDRPPVTFGRYTGQDDMAARKAILENPPDVLMTNFVMLEYILTRFTDRRLVEAMKGLRFLVLDELHTYRGRQGADVALLVRRLREATQSPVVQCVGTSATLSTEGDHESRQKRLAEVGARLFGSDVNPAHVIGETLRRVTPPGGATGETSNALAESVRRSEPPGEFEEFVADPLSCWIENTFGVHEDDGRLVRAIPQPITGPGGAATELSDSTGAREPACETAIRRYLLAGNRVENPITDNPVFPFRLHQFISRGDTVYATPEPPPVREFSMSGQRFVPDSTRRRVFLPLVFCRVCGQDYYMAHRRSTDAGEWLERRRVDDNEPRDGLVPGFWYASEDHPWPDDPVEAERRLPPDWSDPKTGRLRTNRRDHMPAPLRVGADGSVDLMAEGTRGWWVPAPFRFCLACGVSYSQPGKNDFARVATLGAGGRASATTVMSLATIQHLQESALDREARKLLSFTDNRQDASLQAGHFNDFIEVTMLRSALWQAVNDAGADGLRHDRLARGVFDAMALPRGLYAAEPDQHEGARHRVDKTMLQVLEYRLYRDFERGWRITQPNLEQVGLLRIDYEHLSELASDADVWADCHPTLANCDPGRREHVLRVLLDSIRQELALFVGVLNRGEQESLERNAGQHLTQRWSLRGEELRPATEMVAYPRDPREKKRRHRVTSRSLFGRFLRRSDTLAVPSSEKVDLVISQIVERLRRYSLLRQVGGKNGRELWQIPAAALIWKVGEGTEPFRDHLRVARAPERIPTNRFFVDLYRKSGDGGLVGMKAREHTAQVGAERRIRREEQFRSADLPVMYCSPTMELGVDIAQLNVVNLRNVPPTPANYAQRSGRAGRGGQPALVFTYCSSGNSHDQHFFRDQAKMVSGQVEAPRVDLANADLLRSHVHAVWLAESGLNLGDSMSGLLDMGEDHNQEPTLKPYVWDALQNQGARKRTRQAAHRILEGLDPELEQRDWWSGEWLDDTLANIPARFEQSLERWKALYMAALKQFHIQSAIAVSPNRSAQDQKTARRLRNEAERQLDVLRAKTDHRGQSDFYPYRYFASEGFLPGYSFPRLPLSAFIPGQSGRRADADYVQRPRFLAINEFGPHTFIYHEGARYLINRVLLSRETTTPESGLTTQAKRCGHCGYMHPVDEQTGQDVCAYCEGRLGMPLSNLLQMRNVSTRYRERITSDEERRRRMGYELISGIQFAERRGSRSVAKATVVSEAGDPLLDLSYGDTATIWRVNLGWRRRRNKQDHGFYLDTEKGEWHAPSGQGATSGVNVQAATTKKVIPYVKDSRNSLLVEPAQPLSVEQMASLAAALKAAMQVVFQLEPNELAAEPLPTRDDRRLLLFYESAEGGAGVLRQLVGDPEWWQRIASAGLRLCHADQQGPVGEGCGGACYECLLTYQNQLDHELLDRAKVIPILKQLLSAGMKRHLRNELQAESSLEDKFLAFLTTGEYRMPDRSHVFFENARTEPDYVYDEACAVVYVDGPHHDYPDRAARDRHQEQAMLSLGYRTIRFHHQDDWQRIIARHPEVFGTGNGGDGSL